MNTPASMSQPRLLTLLSDFGLDDVYVGVMKGIIAQINPMIRIIDLTHTIPPQNILVAQFNLMNAYPYFPPDTVHVAVVDPGVGGDRRAIALQWGDGFVVGPDNGLFTGLMDGAGGDRHSPRPLLQAVELTNRHYWRVPNPSNTFHGRDIFAPVAAHLASGVALSALGNPIDPDSLMRLSLPPYQSTATGLMGKIQSIDRFGNVITTIPGEAIAGKRWFIRMGSRTIPGCRTYHEVATGEPLALVGSHGWVEIAVNGGDARYQLRVDWNDDVQVVVAT